MLSLLRVGGRRIGLLPSQVSGSGRSAGPSLPRPKLVPRRWANGRSRAFTNATAIQQQVQTAEKELDDIVPPPPAPSKPIAKAVKDLPVVCPGCGAPSQTIDGEAAGFFSLRRSAVTTYMKDDKRKEDEIFAQAMSKLEGSTPLAPVTPSPSLGVPICDRCHQLLHHSEGEGIIHPSMESIREIIEESPHKHNHIYHVVDAADFPMSLIPNLQHALHLPRMRTQNRRSKSMRYIRGRVAEVSFIITRSDLLAPQKEQVDRLMPYLQEVLRDALGRSGRKIRLGNVRLVSAKRGWWTPNVKEEIWKRGGAGWMVGKVNVGKSALFEVVYPKGRTEEGRVEVQRAREAARKEDRVQASLGETAARTWDPKDGMSQLMEASEQGAKGATSSGRGHDQESYQETELELTDEQLRMDKDDHERYFDEEDTSLLPPAQPETAYPSMPLVSSLPGTTASPIRIPFGGGKGELIDLPGIHRSSLEASVKAQHKAELVMKSRIIPEQYSVKPGQSMLLGGLIRITPKTDELVFLVYPFVPLKPHVTSTEKAVGVQTGFMPDGSPYEGNVSSIAIESARQSMKSAGTFKLEWNVTRRRAGPLVDPAAGKQKPDNLPFIVYGADLLVEGVGWVEITCQVRSRRKSLIREPVADALGEQVVRKEVVTVPEVEVFSPQGQSVGVRRPMNAWVLGGPKPDKKGRYGGKSRPRMTISFKRRTTHGG